MITNEINPMMNVNGNKNIATIPAPLRSFETVHPKQSNQRIALTIPSTQKTNVAIIHSSIHRRSDMEFISVRSGEGKLFIRKFQKNVAMAIAV